MTDYVYEPKTKATPDFRLRRVRLFNKWHKLIQDLVRRYGEVNIDGKSCSDILYTNYSAVRRGWASLGREE